MKKIAITGCIASGKSLLLYEIKKRGFPVFDCDKAISQLYQDMTILQKVKKIFPETFEDDILKKERLRVAVINNKLKIKQLEEILYPYLYIKMQEFEVFYRRKNTDMIFFEVPLLFERHREKNYDRIIVVNANLWQRKKNFLKRNLDLRVFSMLNTMQWSNSKKLAIAKINKYLLFSAININNTKHQIDTLLQQI